MLHQCRKCHHAVHYKCSRLSSHQIQLCLSFKEQLYQCPNCIKASQQVLEELKKRHDKNQQQPKEEGEHYQQILTKTTIRSNLMN